MREVKGMFFQMIHNLLSEYNPEIAEDVAKVLSFDINNVKPGAWYPREEINKYIDKISPQARKVIAKKVYPTIKENTPLLDDCTGPLDVINKMNELVPLTERGEDLTEVKILESGNDFVKLKYSRSFTQFPEIIEGMIVGIFEMFKIIKIHVKTSQNLEEDETIHEVKW